MKKITVFVIISAICLSALCSCSDKTVPVKEEFSSPTVISGLFCAYFESVEKNIMKPSCDACAEDAAEYTYMTEDGAQTAHAKLTSAYRFSDNAWSVNVKDHGFTVSNGLSADGYKVRSVTDKNRIQKAVDVFVKAFVQSTKDTDYETAPDSIRASEDDVEVTRITLRLDKERYAAAFDFALNALKNNAEAREYLTDLLGFYGDLHNREESAEELFENLINTFSDAVKNSDGQLVWQRYVYNGKIAAERLKFGDSVIRYICAQASSYTELDLSAKVGEKEITLSYEARRTGMSDTYNIRVSNGDEITYFDGKAESAYKSGNIGFELRATKSANVINGAYLSMSYNGEKQLTYKGSGNFTVNGDKKTFSFELVYGAAENVAVNPGNNGETSLYETMKRIFG